MSAIGIIVTCGIVVNDSILKLDTINELRKAGVPLVEAIHTAGKRRLRAIIMTSLTTIFAMVPLLFTSDMAKTIVYCHDWFDGSGNIGQFVHYSFDILVYL